jgi:hypothetical protein
MSIKFDVYRYQIVPITYKQLNLFNRSISLSELKRRKNEYFINALKDIIDNNEFEYRNHDIVERILFENKNYLIAQFALDRGKVQLENPDFTEDRFQNYPNFIIAINNDPQKQYIFIEREYKAFRNTFTAAQVIEENINHKLNNFLLNVSINPIFHESDFWSLVEKYPSIYRLDFDLVAPNLTNISGSLEESVRNWFPDTNTQEIDINMKGSKRFPIKVDKNIEPVSSFAKYVSDGGGEISFRSTEAKGTITTKKVAITFECRDLEIHADGDVENLSDLIKLLNSEISYEKDNQSDS